MSKTLAVFFVVLLAAWCCLGSRKSAAADLQALHPPWQVDYHDGSANHFRFWQDSEAEAVRFDYTPVRPEESSTGFYSGGEPRQGALKSQRAAELRRWILKLSASCDLHVQDRAKGTGAFAVKTPEGTRSFIVQNGERLREFEAFLRPLKK